MEIGDDDTKLTLHGLQQYYVKLQEAEKNRSTTCWTARLQSSCDLCQQSRARRTRPPAHRVQSSVCIHSGMGQEERISRYKDFRTSRSVSSCLDLAAASTSSAEHRGQLRLPRGQGGQRADGGFRSISPQSGRRTARPRRAWPSTSSRPRRTPTSWPRSRAASRSTCRSCRTRSTSLEVHELLGVSRPCFPSLAALRRPGFHSSVCGLHLGARLAILSSLTADEWTREREQRRRRALDERSIRSPLRAA